jgi:hypothetical protein
MWDLGMWEFSQGNGYAIGQFLIRPQGGMTIVEQPLRPGMTQLLRHNLPNGEVRLVHPGARERYRITTDLNGLQVTREIVHTLNRDDPEYFADLHDLLKTHEQLLMRVAGLSGLDSSVLINLRMRNPGARHLNTRVNAAVKKLVFKKLPDNLEDPLITSTTAIWHCIRHDQDLSTTTGTMEDTGLAATARRVGPYFVALLQQPSGQNPRHAG